MSVLVEFSGKYACFSRPELKTERVTYDVPTPSALRGMLSAIYWHPGLEWKIDKIYVMSPIAYDNIRRNEVKVKLDSGKAKSAMLGTFSKPLYISSSANILQRAAMVLKDVRYVVAAHFEMGPKVSPEDSEAKFISIFNRRLSKGQCFTTPYLGNREFSAKFEPWAGGEIHPIQESRDLGIMLYDLDYSDPTDIQPMYFHAVMTNGVIDVAGSRILR